jgi:luciferase family oxidoreductase group 1
VEKCLGCDGGRVYSQAAPGLPVSAHSVLDVVPQLPGQSAAAALRETAEVAQAADDLGYRRFWLGEQHGIRGVGSASPAVLAAVLAARTDRIRLGSGSVMLTNHQPLVIAEQFAALAAAYPSRIDLGVGKAPSVPPSTATALGWTDAAWNNFPQRLDELCRFLRDGLPGRAPVGDVRLALAGLPPPVFVQTDTPAGAQVAAVRGLPVLLLNHAASAATLASVSAYRDNFEATEPTGKQYVVVSVGVAAADTEEEAVARLAEYVRVKGRLKTAGNRATPAELIELLAQPITSRERIRAERLLDDSGYVVGTRAGVAAGLAAVAASTGADEIMLVPLAFDGLARSAILRTVAAGLTRAIRSVPRHTPHFVATA